MVTDHATPIHLLKHASDNLTNRQIHCDEKLMSYANLMHIVYMKGILNESEPMSRRPDFLPVDDVHRPDASMYLVG